MSQSATPAMQNDMTTCMETFEKEVFCRFPHRHNDATGKRDTQTRHVDAEKKSVPCETSSNCVICDTLSNRLECQKVPRLPHKTTWQPAWKHSKRRGFPASPMDTATPQKHKRRKTRHLDTEKLAFCARLPAIFTVADKIKRQVLQLPP